MAGIEDPDVVDVVTVAPSGEYALIIAAVSPWTDTVEQLNQLLQKINRYIDYAEGGGLATTDPRSVGHPVRIQIDCTYPPTETVEEVIKHAERTLDALGIRLVVEVLS